MRADQFRVSRLGFRVTDVCACQTLYICSCYAGQESCIGQGFLPVRFAAPPCAPVYPCVPMCTPVYPYLSLCIPVYPCVPLRTPVYPCVPSCIPAPPLCLSSRRAPARENNLRHLSSSDCSAREGGVLTAPLIVLASVRAEGGAVRL